MAKRSMKSKTKPNSDSNSKKSTAKQVGTDIILLILRDHKPLKALLKTMKDEKPTYQQKRAAFEKFEPLLMSHAKPEEETWYKMMKSEDESRIQGLEGDVEHGLASQLCEELKATDDQDLFMAKVKVLAELVEHHIEEEEEEMLPDYKKDSTMEERTALGQKYSKMQESLKDQDESSPLIEKGGGLNRNSPNPNL